MITTWMMRSFIVFSLITVTTRAEIQPLSINFSPTPQINISVSIQNNEVLAFNTKTKKNEKLASISGLPAYARDLWVEDFNFDGHLDIAVSTSADSAHLSPIYSIYTWNNTTQTLTLIPFNSAISNIELDNDNKVLRSSYNSGDFWREDSYHFIQGVAYLHSRADQLATDVWHTTTFDRSHKVAQSYLSKNSRNRNISIPLTGRILSQDTVIHNAPQPSSFNNTRLNRGQTVQLLDFKKSNNGLHWLQIRSDIASTTVEGWVPLNSISF